MAERERKRCRASLSGEDEVVVTSERKELSSSLVSVPSLSASVPAFFRRVSVDPILDDFSLVTEEAFEGAFLSPDANSNNSNDDEETDGKKLLRVSLSSEVDEEVTIASALPMFTLDPFVFMASVPGRDFFDSQLRAMELLPPPAAPKPCLVLDLDETLVHSSLAPLAGADFSFLVDCGAGVDTRIFTRLRPGCLQFLEAVCKTFEVVVFTASKRVYADKVLDYLDAEGRFFSHRLFRESCYMHCGLFLKDLAILNRDLAKTVLVDNSPSAFSLHVENGIPISSWFGNCDNDKELLYLVPFLEKLTEHDDFRHVLEAEFQLKKKVVEAASKPHLF